MSEIGRRRFLQFLGLGGATAATLTTPIPVFGSDDGPKLWTPDQKIVGGHLVLVPPKDWSTQRWKHPSGGRIELSTDDPESGEAIVGQVGRAWPTVRDRIYWDSRREPLITVGPQPLRLSLEPSTTQTVGQGVQDRPHTPHAEHAIAVPLSEKHTSEEAHAAFYKGAQELRKRFKAESLKILERVPVSLRQDAQIVTLVNNAVYADALYAPALYEQQVADHVQQPGFTLRAEWSQYVVVGEVERNGWQVYSETGEYPIEIPSDLDMEFLLHMDKMMLTSVTYNISNNDSWTVVTTPGGKWTIPGVEPQTLGKPIKRPKILKP